MQTFEYNLDLEPAKIYIDDTNWFWTQAYLDWAGRKFYFRNKNGYAHFLEFEEEVFESEELGEYGMDYPTGEMTSDEIGKLFWHLVAYQDPRVKENQKKINEQIYRRIEENNARRSNPN